jgi:hypothetical protein
VKQQKTTLRRFDAAENQPRIAVTSPKSVKINENLHPTEKSPSAISVGISVDKSEGYMKNNILYGCIPPSLFPIGGIFFNKLKRIQCNLNLSGGWGPETGGSSG